MKRAAILVESGFQDEEFVYPYYRLLEEGWWVDVASPDGENRIGKYGVPARVSHGTAQLKAAHYDLVLVPGGFESPDRLRTDYNALDFVRDMHAAGKTVAAICHGPWVLISAKIVEGRNLTGYKSIQADLENAGAIYSPAAVMTDGNIVTAQHYRDNGSFMRAVVMNVNVRLPSWGPEYCGAAAVNL